MRVFLAGATGVMGRRAIPLFREAGHDVTAVARSQSGNACLEELGAAPVFVDLFDPAAVRRAVAGHDVICNLATRIPLGARAFLPGAFRENDRIRTHAPANLVDAGLASGATHFIQESFAPVYPDGGDAWIDERTPIAPAAYCRTVLDAEAAAVRFAKAGGQGIVLRFALLYGPDSAHTLDTITFVRKGWAATFGSPESFVSSVSTDDAAAAIVAAVKAPAGAYNVSDDEPLRRREYFSSLALALGVATPKLPPTWMTKLAGSLGETIARSQRLSNAKLKGATNWAPRYPSAREGWRFVVDAVRHGARHEE